VAGRRGHHQRCHPRHLPGPRASTWIPGQRQRLRQLDPGTWDQALADVLGNHGRQDDDPAYSAVEIAIYPDVVWLAMRSLRAHSASHRAAS
jgi:hypothetical protein